MENLLSATSYRRIKLIHLLSLSKQWLHLDEIAADIGCSKKTIMEDYHYISDNWSDILAIERDTVKGVRMHTISSHSVQEVYIDLIKESSTVTLLEAIFFTPNQTSEYWEKMLFSSKTSIYRALQKTNQILKKRAIWIDPSTYKICSPDERTARFFMTYFFLNTYGKDYWPFPFTKTKVLKLAKKINEHFHLEFNNSLIIKFSFLIAVTLIREQQGILIETEGYNPTLHKNYMQGLKVFKDDIRNIITPYSTELPENWTCDFSHSVFLWRFVWNNQEEEKRVLRMSETLTEHLITAVDLPISEKSRQSHIKLFTFLYAKQKVLSNTKFSFYNRKIVFNLILKERFPLFYNIIAQSLQERERKDHFPWYSVYFDEILFEMMNRWEDLPASLDKFFYRVNVGIFSDLGEKHAEFLVYFFNQYFKSRINISVRQDALLGVPEYMYSNLELVIANFCDHCFSGKNVLVINDIPSFNDVIALNHFVEQKRKENYDRQKKNLTHN